MRRLEQKRTIITGAAHGIGRGLALRFAQEGAAVGVFDISAANCAQVVAEIVALGGQAISLEADLTQPAQVNGAVSRFAEHFGPPNILVNNAGVMANGSVHLTSAETFDRVIGVNLRGAFLASAAVLPYMLEARAGSIVQMASVTGIRGAQGMAAYSTAKGGLLALTRAMAIDYAPYGIRVNSVSPGTIDSPMLQAWVAAQSDPHQTRRAFDAVYPIGRIGTIDEVVSVFVFLASDEASFVTGANYVVDGGLSVKADQPQD